MRRISDCIRRSCALSLIFRLSYVLTAAFSPHRRFTTRRTVPKDPLPSTLPNAYIIVRPLPSHVGSAIICRTSSFRKLRSTDAAASASSSTLDSSVTLDSGPTRNPPRDPPPACAEGAVEGRFLDAAASALSAAAGSTQRRASSISASAVGLPASAAALPTPESPFVGACWCPAITAEENSFETRLSAPVSIDESRGDIDPDTPDTPDTPDMPEDDTPPAESDRPRAS